MSIITRAIVLNAISEVNEAAESASVKGILAVYNRFAPTPVARFSDRKTAVRRTLALLNDVLTLTPEEKEEEAAPEVAAPKSLSESITLSWANPEIARKRLTRNGVIAYVGDKAIEFKSLRVAFEALKLPDSKHIAFRQILKREKSATFTFGKTSVKFSLV